MVEFLHIMMLPLLACLVLAGIHAYLGFHVIQRQVIFVDLALAQIAALGASLAILTGHDLDSLAAYGLSLGFTVLGAGIFSLTRLKNERLPQEAIIGITYAVATALLVMILSRSGQGDEHIKQALVGNILLVSVPEVIKITMIYFVVGGLHVLFRRQFLLISQDPQKAISLGLNVRGWDFFFYVLFGVVVTSSVKIAGVLLVFALLVTPSVCAILFADNLRVRLLIGWSVSFLASILGMTGSYVLDLPTAASVVCALAFIFIILVVVRNLKLTT